MNAQTFIGNLVLICSWIVNSDTSA